MATVELANAIATTRLTSEEVVVASLDRIMAVSGQFNAIVTLTATSAPARACQADVALESGKSLGLLQGMPCTAEVTRGVPAAWNVSTGKGCLPTRSARRLSAAGYPFETNHQ